MDKIVINGGKPLKGEVKISGSKNSTLPLMAAALLTEGKSIIRGVPDLRDIKTMANMLRIIGATVTIQDGTMIIDTSGCNYFKAPYELVKTMRASIYVLGPLVARFGEAEVSLPGGCAWGPRPVDFHIQGIKKLGAEVKLENGYIIAKSKKLIGNIVNFDIPSVGATCNILMAATLAKGKTIIQNSAIEPEVTSLADFLVKMGARINGIGTSELEIIGVDELFPVDSEVISDRIEAGTFLVAGAITGGEITLHNCEVNHIESVIHKLEETGCEFQISGKSVTLFAPKKVKAVDVKTAVYPGFPTDMQAQWIALMAVAEGSCTVTDTIYKDRFTHVPELNRLGANIKLNGNIAFVKGRKEISGASVMSTDLRASACLIIAGLVARGRTDVLRVYHIDRGYEKIEEKLKQLGADIWREEGGL